MYLGNVVQTELLRDIRFELSVAEYIIRGQEIHSLLLCDSAIEVNTVERVDSILGDELLSQEDPGLVNLLLHFIGYLDIVHKTRSDLVQKMIIDRLIELGYTQEIGLFIPSELEHIIANYLKMKTTHLQLRYFTDSISIIFKSQSLFFDEKNDTYILTTGESYGDDIDSKARFIIDLFFDFASDISIYWGNIGIIDSKYSPIIDKTLIYDEE